MNDFTKNQLVYSYRNSKPITLAKVGSRMVYTRHTMTLHGTIPGAEGLLIQLGLLENTIIHTLSDGAEDMVPDVAFTIVKPRSFYQDGERIIVVGEYHGIFDVLNYKPTFFQCPTQMNHTFGMNTTTYIIPEKNRMRLRRRG